MQASVKYAPDERPAARSGRRFILVAGGILSAVLVAGFISLGLWQWNKYATKTSLQSQLDETSHSALVAMPSLPANAESLRYRHVELHGEFDVTRQILIDNRVDAASERVGYHVVTPLRLAGSDMHVLVNRGWVPAAADRQILPHVLPPNGTVTLTGIAVVPPSKFFTLASRQPMRPDTDTSTTWEPVWQNLDLARFVELTHLQLQPVVVQLDPTTMHGFERSWTRPDDRAEKHLSYALQWFGFAASTVGIWLYLLLRR